MNAPQEVAEGKETVGGLSMDRTISILVNLVFLEILFSQLFAQTSYYRFSSCILGSTLIQ